MVLFIVASGSELGTGMLRFRLVPGWHVCQRFLGAVDVFEKVLYGRLEVEGLDEGSLVQGESVAHAPDLDALRLHAHTQLRMVPDTSLDNVWGGESTHHTNCLTMNYTAF